MRPFNENRDDNNEHPNQCYARGARKFVYVTVERKRVRDADGAEKDDELAIGKNLENRYTVKSGKYEADDVWYCVADDDSECAHA